MNISGIESCCTARILSGFGAADAALYPDQYNGLRFPNTKEALLNQMLTAKRSGNAVVIAFTNNKQKEGNALLREIGFKRTKWMSKTAHPNTKLRLWWFPLETLEA
jgi:hypothetical protein